MAFSSILLLKPLACVPALSQCKWLSVALHYVNVKGILIPVLSFSFVVVVENLPQDRRRLGCSSDEKSFTSDGLRREGKQWQLSVCEGKTLHRL